VPIVKEVTVCGGVVNGKHVGRELGIPTANVDFDLETGLKGLPNGIYKVRVQHAGKQLAGTASLGFNPHVEHGNCIRKLEVYVQSWNHDIEYYGEVLSVRFLRMIRF
jgi:FAD synthase